MMPDTICCYWHKQAYNKRDIAESRASTFIKAQASQTEISPMGNERKWLLKEGGGRTCVFSRAVIFLWKISPHTQLV